jgi:hypothetical protein
MKWTDAWQMNIYLRTNSLKVVPFLSFRSRSINQLFLTVIIITFFSHVSHLDSLL